MRAGFMRERITIETQATGVAANGTPSGGWSSVCSVRAAIKTLSGREGYEADQNTARFTHEILIRYRSDVTPDQRVTWGARTLHIIGAVADPKRRQLTLQCDERIGNAA